MLPRQAHRQVVEAAAVSQLLVAAEMQRHPGHAADRAVRRHFRAKAARGAALLRPTMLPPVPRDGVAVAVAEVVRIYCDSIANRRR